MQRHLQLLASDGLNPEFVGPVIKITNVDNTDSLDVYFTSEGIIDTNAVKTFSAGTSTYVYFIANQFSGGNNFYSPDASRHVQLTDGAGDFYYENDRLSMYIELRWVLR